MTQTTKRIKGTDKHLRHNSKRRAKVDAYLGRNLPGYDPLGSLSPTEAMAELRHQTKAMKGA